MFLKICQTPRACLLTVFENSFLLFKTKKKQENTFDNYKLLGNVYSLKNIF